MIIVDVVKWVLVLQFCIGSLLPAVVGLVTTKLTDPGWKAILLLVLAFVSSILTQLLTALNGHVPFDLVTALVLGFGTFVLSVCVHFGVNKPTQIADWLASVGRTADPAQLAIAEAAAPMVSTMGVVQKPVLSAQLSTVTQPDMSDPANAGLIVPPEVANLYVDPTPPKHLGA